MKRPLQLPLAIALALGGTNALALGLGPVHVHSKLNQPLDAEIPVLQGSAGEAEGLLASLAAAEDFERVGLSRSRLTVPLEFAVSKNAKGEVIIKVTSKEPVRDTYLDFLVEANWPKGRLLREYTVLLDPPTTAPATRSAATAAAPAAAPGTAALARREAPAEKPAAAPAPTPTPRASTPKPAPVASAPKAVKEGQYGPVEGGETLSAIARSVRDGNLNQTMIALLKANPNAFYKDNINALKRGAILRIPSADEIKAVGSASEAAAQVQSQVEDWRGGRASPTLVADAGSKPAPTAATATPPKKAVASAGTAGGKNGERLELVPPKAGKDSMAMADRPGSGAGSPAATELKSELARTKEALTSREQETGELRSRVKELEDLKSKNDRLIGLKDSEIAELQQKLKQLQGGPAPAKTAAATGAATATPPAANDKIAKQDIWGSDGAAKPATTNPAAPSASTGATTPAPGGTGTPPAVSASGTSGSSASSTPPSATPPASNASSSTSATPAASTSAGTSTTPAAAVATPPASASSTPSASTPSAATTPPATTPPPSAATPPATATPKPAIAKPKPAPVATEWYDEPWFLPGAIGAGILVLLLALFGLRKKRTPAPVVAERGSIADAFGDSPLDGAPHGGVVDGEEAKLREQLRHDPRNVGLHLELLSLYYAEREVGKFEDAAAEMHAYVGDAHQPEWLEAQAMGRELAPANPLFAEHVGHDDVDPLDEDRAAALAHAQAQRGFLLDDEHDGLHAPKAVEHAFELDPHFGELPAAPGAPAPAAAKHDDGFDFDLPPLGAFDPPPPPPQPAHVREHGQTPVPPAPVHHLDDDFDLPPAPAPAPARAAADDEFFHGDDAIGTKLDLAKAYMDMGDPEGARSMLEEVVVEGSDTQKAEARRLMAEMR